MPLLAGFSRASLCLGFKVSVLAMEDVLGRGERFPPPLESESPGAVPVRIAEKEKGAEVPLKVLISSEIFSGWNEVTSRFSLGSAIREPRLPLAAVAVLLGLAVAVPKGVSGY